MGLGDLLKKAGDMVHDLKHTIEEKTGVDLDAMQENAMHKLDDAKHAVADKFADAQHAVSGAINNPSGVVDAAKEKFAEVQHAATDAIAHPGHLVDEAKSKLADAENTIQHKVENLTGNHDAGTPA